MTRCASTAGEERLELRRMTAGLIKLYISVLMSFLVIEALWLGLVARGFYGRYLGELLRPSPNWLAALLFYLLFVAGLLVFVVLPHAESGSVKRMLLHGAFFGLVTYATYDLTNLATIRNWPLIVTVVDLAWGATVASILSLLGAFCARRLL
jgi:uncharacterized membrane protein